MFYKFCRFCRFYRIHLGKTQISILKGPRSWLFTNIIKEMRNSRKIGSNSSRSGLCQPKWVHLKVSHFLLLLWQNPFPSIVPEPEKNVGVVVALKGISFWYWMTSVHLISDLRKEYPGLNLALNILKCMSQFATVSVLEIDQFGSQKTERTEQPTTHSSGPIWIPLKIYWMTDDEIHIFFLSLKKLIPGSKDCIIF